MKTPFPLPPELRDRLRRVESVCVLTGAGISAESGVPTFRGDEGLWKKFRPEELANVDAFLRNPQLVWEWYRYRRRLIGEVHPNAGHEALARWEARGKPFTLVTQNVDGLHRRAGSRNVIELHGDIQRTLCLDCRGEVAPVDETVDLAALRCACGGRVRPGVVWFGESLPEGALERAAEAAEACELFLCVGTSGAVYPAAALPAVARRAGAFVVEVNPERTAVSAQMHATLLGRAGEILPQLLAALPSG